MNPNVNDPSNYVVIRRRRMTRAAHERLARAARKMGQDFRKFIKRKEQRKEI